jgi:hypothetical protein
MKNLKINICSPHYILKKQQQYRYLYFSNFAFSKRKEKFEYDEFSKKKSNLISHFGSILKSLLFVIVIFHMLVIYSLTEITSF